MYFKDNVEALGHIPLVELSHLCLEFWTETGMGSRRLLNLEPPSELEAI